MSRRVITSPMLPAPMRGGAFSAGTEAPAGRTIYVSGQVSIYTENDNQAAGKRLGHATWVLDLHEVCRSGQDETFGVRQPSQQQPVRLTEAGPEGVAIAAEHGQARLSDAPRFRLAEAPSQLPGRLALEPGFRVGHRLSEGSR